MRQLRRLPRIAVAALLVALFAACAPGASPSLHDVYLYGAGGEHVRYAYFYGGPTRFTVDGREIALTEGTADDPLAVPGALLADGMPYLRDEVEPIEPPVTATRIPLTTSIAVATRTPLEEVVYYDGSMWLTLLEEAPQGVNRRVAPKPRLGRLRGVGELTAAEADRLATYLEQRGSPLVVAVLPSDAVPRRTIDGLESYAATGIYVQDTIPMDAGAYTPPPQQLTWDVIDRGSQAVGIDAPQFHLVETEAELIRLWNQAWGSRLQPPPVPDVDFRRETVLAIFQGQRPTGGYGIEIDRVAMEGGEVFVDMRFVEPAPDAIVTQALTSPWAMVRVLRGGIDVAWFRNPATGELLGVARAD